ncbi:MAG: hypothetical protein PGN24_12575 [Microbacterium arborescens]
MVCIVAFVVVLLGSAVSARYRRLLGRAASCAWRRVRLRACDTTFREDVKASLLAPLATRAPRLVRPASIGIEVVAWLLVLSMIVSVYLLGRSGLNLFVYGTCDKQDAQSCSLAAEMCSIDGAPGFAATLATGDVVGAFGQEAASLAETIAAVPSRLRTWDAAEYVSLAPSYLGGYRPDLPTAVEIIDPGCRFCAQLLRNVHESGFAENHNLTYLVYPIPAETGSRFANSPLVARFLTAIRLHDADLHGADRGPGAAPAAPTETADWHVLEQIFTGTVADGTAAQTWLNAADPAAAQQQLDAWVAEAGYTPDDIAAVHALAGSDAVAAELARVEVMVRDDIRTLAIPSLIAGGSLRSGLVDVDTLRGLR